MDYTIFFLYFYSTLILKLFYILVHKPITHCVDNPSFIKKDNVTLYLYETICTCFLFNSFMCKLSR